MDPAMSPLLMASMPERDNDKNTTFQSLSPGMSHGLAERLSPSTDGNALQQENRMLKLHIRQLQNELQTEQDSVSSLRRKINGTERERLDSISKVHEEAARLDSEVTRLRALVEKGEAVRQNLEFELAKARKEIGQDKRSATEKENLLGELNESMKHKISDLSQQVEQLCQELETSKAKAEEDLARSRFTIDERDNQISLMRTERDILEAEKDKVENALTQQEASIHDMEIRVKELEDERRTMADGIRRQAADMDVMKEREQRLKRDMEAAMARIKSLEEGIEAERAAHLETKFNSEIVQLRIRDLEGALEVEKTAKTDALVGTEKSNNQIRELQKLNDEQRREAIQSREKLEKDLLLKCVLPATRAEKEYALVNQQLQGDLEKKNGVISKLSNQLELHQKNFDELKEELSKAKKRQIYLEETYGGSMRELELLLNNFNLDAEPKKSKLSKTGKKKDGTKGIPPSIVLENLRHTLIEYKRRLDITATELNKMKSQHEQLTKECDSYKDMIWAKDKALENTAQSLTKTSKTLQKSKSDADETERKVVEYRTEVETLRKTFEKEHAQHLEMKEQMVKVATKCKTDEQAHLEFLRSILHQLMIGRPLSERDQTLHSKSSWSDLTLAVQEQIANAVHSLQRANEKVHHLESVVGSKESAISEMQRVHDEQLEKLAGVTEDRGNFWQKQKGELEEHYSHLLAEVQARNKKTQSLADQAWEKVRVTGTIQQGLKAEVQQLRQEADQSNMEKQVLLTTCSLLCGALYPLYARVTALITQRNILSEQLARFEGFKLQVQRLVEALNTDKEEQPQQKVKCGAGPSPLQRFRVAAVTVLAANRLVHFTKGHCRMFTAYDVLPGLHGMLVCPGHIQLREREFQGVATPCSLSRDRRGRPEKEEEMAMRWLTSSDLMATVMATMADIHAAISKAQQHGSRLDSEHLMSAAKSSFSKLVCHLPTTFPTVAVETGAGLRDKVSLIRFLGQGLKRLQAHALLEGQTAVLGSQKTLALLQQQVLAFTRHLHTAEVERRDLRVEVSTLRQERQALKMSAANADNLSTQINQFKQQLDVMVPKERFDSVCHELDNALSRERQAQELLTEQAHQLKSLNQAMNRHAADGTEKDQTLTELVQGLSDAKLEMRRQEQLVRQLNRQLSQLETEKKMFLTNVADAENALRTAAKDKDVMALYLKNVEHAIGKITMSSSRGPVDLTPLLSPELLPKEASAVSPEVAACQLLVTAFVDAQGLLNKRIRALQEEIASYRSHINTLKRELAAACKREYDDDLKFADGAPEKDISFTGKGSGQESHALGSFVPLVEDKSSSFIIPTKASVGRDNRTEPIQERPAKLTKPSKAKAKGKNKVKDPCTCRSATEYRIPRQASRQASLHRGGQLDGTSSRH